MISRYLSWFAGVCLIMLSGCQVYYIKADTNGASKESQSGVPFYVKTVQFVQTTRFARVWNVVELTLKWHDEGKLVSKTYSFNIDPHKDTSDLRTWSAPSGGLKVITDAFRQKLDTSKLLLKPEILQQETVVNSKNCSPTTGSDDKPVSGLKPASHVREQFLSNKVDRRVVVDYSRKYYFNVRVPPFGTADGSVKLNDDGTLSNGEGNVSMEKLGDMFPLKEILLDKWGINLAAMKSALPVESINVSVKEVGREYVLTKKWPLDSKSTELRVPLKVCDALSGQAEIQVLNFASKAANSTSQKKKDDSKAIKIAGSIQMPK